MSLEKQLLTYPGSKALSVATCRDTWQCPVVKDQFWKIADKDRMEAQPPFVQSFDSLGEKFSSPDRTPFMDHKEGKGIFINPRSILRMRIERA